MRKQNLVVSLVLVIIVGLLSAACAQPAPSPKPAAPPAPAPAPKPAPTAVQSRQQAIQELYDAAKKEGEVLWQSPTQIANLKPLIDGFGKRYPGVKVSAFFFDATEMPARLITETAAGKVSTDVASGKTTYLSPVFDRDLAISYDWQKVSEVDPSTVAYGGRFTALYDAVPLFIYNTKMVPAAEAPQSFQDLLLPKWKGNKIAVTPSGQFALWLLRQWQKDKQGVLDTISQLRKQELLVGTAAPNTALSVANGEAPIGWTVHSQVIANLAKGAPIAIAKISPTFDGAGGLYIPKNSPHPNAAKLLVSWLGSQEAVPLWQQTPLGGRATAGPVGKLLKDAGVEFVPLTTAKDVQDANDLMKAAAQAAGTVPGK